MKGECFINEKDAYTMWGIVFGDDSLTALLTPPALKSYTENKSALQDGKRIVESRIPKADERTLQLTFYLHARSLETFLQRYSSFTQELMGGKLVIRTKYQPEVRYHCFYLSCNQFTQFNGRLAKFILKLSEPNPNNRT